MWHLDISFVYASGLLWLLEWSTNKIQWRGDISCYIHLGHWGMYIFHSLFSFFDLLYTQTDYWWMQCSIVICSDSYFKTLAVIATLILFWQITVDVDHKRAGRTTGRVIDLPASQRNQQPGVQSGATTSTAVVWIAGHYGININPPKNFLKHYLEIRHHNLPSMYGPKKKGTLKYEWRRYLNHELLSFLFHTGIWFNFCCKYYMNVCKLH